MTIIRTLWLIGALALSGCAGGGGGGGHGGGGGGGTPPPVLTSLSPASVTVGGPTFTLTINGSNFAPGGSVIWNGGSLGSYTFVSASQVTLLVGASQIVAAGSASIGVQIPNVSASNTVALAISPFTTSACVLFGPYDFFFTGFDSIGPVTIAGSFGVDTSGNVTGEQDFKTTMTTHAAQPITGGSCVNGATADEGTLTLTTSVGMVSYAFVTQTHPHAGIKGRMTASAAPSGGISGSGRFALASGGFFSGDFVLGIVGSDASGGRMGVLGRFTDTTPGFSTPGTLSAGMGDINDNGITSQAVISGTVGVPDAYSRSAAMVTVGTQTLQLAIYVLGPGVGFAANADPAASSPLLAGFVNTQANAGVYNNGNLSAPVGLTVWGASPGPSAASDTLVGIASGFSTAGTFNLLFDQVAGGMASLNQTVIVTYAIAPNGRGTASFTSGGKPHSLVLYLDDFNDGYVLDTGSNVGYGFFGAQGTGPFTNATIQTTFAAGTWFSPVAASPNTVGQLTFNSNLTVSGAATGTYAVDPPGTTGRGTATLNAPLFGSNHVVFYIGSANSLVLMGSDLVTGDGIAFLNR